MKPVSHYAKLLSARRAALQSRLSEIEHDLDAPAPKDWEDYAVEREGDEVMERLGTAGLAELRAVEAALERIQAGSFGICPRCGTALLEERLDAVPHAALCRTCAGAGPSAGHAQALGMRSSTKMRPS
ncbi:MAG: TraR/DksA family transcriptional regulator [Pseudomonadota bacterium]